MGCPSPLMEARHSAKARSEAMRRHWFVVKMGTCMLLAAFAADAFPEEQRRIDLSMAWFKPELQLNNRSDICEPVFRRYVEYFASTEAVDPLKPISARGWGANDPGALTKTIRELQWLPLGGEDKGVRLARWRQDRRYLGIIERSQTIGWRPPTYEYFLIDKPVSDAEVNEAKGSFGEGPLRSLRETNKPGLLDVVYQSDPRFKDYKQNIFVQVANVLSTGGRVYLGLIASTYDPGPTVYLIVRVISPRQVQPVCKMTTLPSPKALRAESARIPHYRHFEHVAQEIMGGSGDCGTLNAPARAMFELQEGLATLMYRPWAYASSASSMKSYDLSDWGYSGPWNYRKYREFVTVLPKARQALANKYRKDYKLDKQRAYSIADGGIRAVLAQAFSHGETQDTDLELHRALLEGESVDEVSPLLPPEGATKEVAADSLLAFAIRRPHLVEHLLQRGWDPNASNAFGKTPLMYAAQFNELESAKLLVKYGANTELATTRPLDSCYYTIATHGVTALHYAVRYASKGFIEWLVGSGAVTAAADSNQSTPLDYLTKFGGFVGYKQTAPLSYGQQNALLTRQDIDSLTRLLTPPGIESRRLESEETNREAESLYRAGKLQEAYAAVKKSLSLNPTNDRAMANLSLIALKLGHHGESAKAATYAIKNATSQSEVASAYFNLGLACRAEGARGFHYATIYYDGTAYCRERWDKYHGPLYYYLEAYRISPTAARANAIVEFLGEADTPGGKWLCKVRDADSEPRAVYVAMNHVYFLTKTGFEIELPRFVRRERNSEQALQVTKKESFPLGNGLSVSRWEVYVPFQGTLVLGDQLCGRFLGSMIEDGTELIEVHTQRGGDQVRISADTSKPIVLVLYGNEGNWAITNGSRNIRAIYVHGKDAKLLQADSVPVVAHMDTQKYVYPEPWGSSFNAYTAMTLGLTIGAIVDATDRPQIRLDDSVLASLPRCEGRIRTNCKTR